MQFFRTDRVFPGVNSNFIVLILKTATTLTMDLFRPIALGSFLFKVITKIIVDRLIVICSHIISPNQFGFIRGKKIGDCIAAAFECFIVLSIDSRGGQLAMKIDIRKAFDSIIWPFLFEVLVSFRFSKSNDWVHTIFLFC